MPRFLVTLRHVEHLFECDQNRRSLRRGRIRPNLDRLRINGVLTGRLASGACRDDTDDAGVALTDCLAVTLRVPPSRRLSQ